MTLTTYRLIYDTSVAGIWISLISLVLVALPLVACCSEWPRKWFKRLTAGFALLCFITFLISLVVLILCTTFVGHPDFLAFANHYHIVEVPK